MLTPAWLHKWLQDPARKQSRRGVKVGRCGHCRQQVLTGDDADWSSFRVTVDPTTLNRDQEIACIITDRRTYMLEDHGGAPELHRRTHWHTDSHPPDDTPVVPAHKCGARFPTPDPQPRLTTANILIGDNDDPPF